MEVERQTFHHKPTQPNDAHQTFNGGIKKTKQKNCLRTNFHSEITSERTEISSFSFFMKILRNALNWHHQSLQKKQKQQKNRKSLLKFDTEHLEKPIKNCDHIVTKIEWTKNETKNVHQNIIATVEFGGGDIMV